MPDPIRVIDTSSPIWITQIVIMAVLGLLVAWSLYQGKAPGANISPPKLPGAPTAPLIDWDNKPKLLGFAFMVLALLSLIISWGTMIYLMITKQALAGLKSDSSWISLMVLVPILLGTIYYFWTGSDFPRLMNLLVLSLLISVVALISSQTQVNT